MDGVKKSVPFVYWADCEDPDQSSMCWHREDALTQINDHGGTLYELSHTSELDAALAREAALQYKADLYDEVWQKATGMGFMNVTMALEQLAALREELARKDRVIEDLLESNGEMTTCLKSEERHESHCLLLDPEEPDCDCTCTAGRLTAAEHDLAVANHEIEARISAEVGAIEALQAAEQRNAELVELLRDSRDLVRPSAVLSPGGESARLKVRLDAALLNSPVPAPGERIPGCADAAWLLYDGNLYGQHGILVMDSATILQKAKSYAGYKPTESGASDAERKEDDEALQRRHDQERQEYFNDEQ